MNEELEREVEHLEDEQASNDDYNETPPADIVAYNELRSCADLFRMSKDGDLDIQPEFQREIVWSNAMQTRLIDSLVKQLPIPSLCISLDYKTEERYVIDGLQRAASVIKFLDEDNEWKLAKLDDIDSKLSGKSNITIKKKSPDIYRKIMNAILPITVLRCDYSKKNHMDYLFTIFHRLNTGGSKLTNQEIRNCIFNGEFNNYLRNIVNQDNYIQLLDVKPDKTYRFSNEELVLRFTAFYDEYENYTGRLSKFLNDYMEENKNIDENKASELHNIVNRTINLINTKILDNNPLPRLSKATTEALFVGIARNIDILENKSTEELKSLYLELRNDDLFSLENLKEGLAQKDKVIARFNKSVEIFSV